MVMECLLYCVYSFISIYELPMLIGSILPLPGMHTKRFVPCFIRQSVAFDSIVRHEPRSNHSRYPFLGTHSTGQRPPTPLALVIHEPANEAQ